MDPHTESGTPVSSGPSSSSDDASTSVPVVNNGPGVAKRHGNSVTVAPSPNTVIQSSYGNPPAAASSAGPSVTVVRPSMQTAGTGLTINGSNNNNTVSATVANVATPGITTNVTTTTSTTTTTPLLMNQSPASASASKSEATKTIIQLAGTMTLGPGVAKGAVLQGVARTAAPVTVAAAAAGSSPAIRAIAPQVLAPRLPQSTPGQNIHNIQLPPGMVLVRSDSGQLLMIPQQMLAQMQAQSQAARPAAPTSTTPGQITSAQAPGTPLMARQVTPTTIIKQGSPTASSTATTTLQRPPVQQASSVGAVLSVQAGTAQRTVTAATGTTVSSATETMENVKKCRNFLSTLIKLATSGKQSSETVANVKELVRNLLEGTIEAEEFTSRLYKELNSSPQPYLVPFLKRSLPALRQLTPDSTAFIQQSQALQAPTVVLTSSNTAGATATVPRTLIQPALSNSSQTASLVLQPPQQGAIVKPPQVTLTTTPMVTLRGQPHSSHIVVGQPQVQLKQIQTVAVKHGVVSSTKLAPGSVSVALAQKNKTKDGAGGTFRDDDDINDVASMAGVNLSEESARILATNSELVGVVTRSCKDEAFLSASMLQHKILEIGQRFGVTELGPEVVNIVSHATQQRLQNLLEKVSLIAQQKNMTYKEDSRYEQVEDVRSQLKFFEQLDQLEKQKKEEQEREILMKAAKSRSRQEDPEQLRLKQKAKEVRWQQELAQIRQREANLTALAAIGPRKKRKLDSPSFGTDTEGSGLCASASGGLNAGASRQYTRQRITRVNLRDLLFCLENERSTSHSQLLYQALLK
ncbi:transcription initiation factor TFIID subunit 4 [Sinocyclocheilus anshuiensis]|uniref:transcription initiation factor TFIID subunit 4 n=1 Tax=Sinocyclocheilus anshuiensis TaxID=1608454 RepID=UPI0007B7FDF0|nr:PREDICTED: transcription initiation factor TFIID subunit 4 [Sinocyclocheilus anshuiensis]